MVYFTRQLMRSTLLAVVLPLCTLSAQAVVATGGVAQATSPTTERKVTLGFKDVSISDALAEISRQSGVPIAVGEDVASTGKMVTFSGTGISVRDAIQGVLRGTGLQMRISSTGQLVVSRTKQGTPVRNAQGVITGKVTDAKTGKGVSGANVSTAGDARSATTGEDGSYRITGIATGTHTVSVRLERYPRQHGPRSAR